MTDNSFTTNKRATGRPRGLVYSVFVLALIASAVYFFAAPTETVRAKKGKAPAPVLAVDTFNTTTGLPLFVPDNNTAGVNLSIPVSGLMNNVTAVELTVTMDGHTYVGDLIMRLSAPGGAPIHTIFERIGSTNGTFGGDSSNFLGPYTFTDNTTGDIWVEASIPTTNGNVPAGSYRTTACCAPSSSGPGIFTAMNPVFAGPALTDFDIKKDMKSKSEIPFENVANGTWNVNISDNVGGDTGSVTQLSLTITTQVPTAATAVVRGRVMTPAGRGIGRAYVTVVNTSTQDSFVVMTNHFGYFIAVDLPVGDVYVMSVAHKQYQFSAPTQTFTLDGDVDDALFISEQ